MQIGDIRIEADWLCAPGRMVLWQGDRACWAGPIGSSIEDAECDKITIHPRDFKIFKKIARQHGIE